MDRRSIIKHAGIAGVLAAGVAPAVHAQAAIRWRLASSFPKSLDTIFGGAEVFADLVKQMSGGKFEISVHAGGELMPAFGVVDGVQQGTVECAHTAPYYFFGKNEAFALGCAIPFRHEQPSALRLDDAWQRRQADGRVLQRLQHRELPLRQHGRPDGWLVPQGNQEHEGHSWSENAHRWLRRHDSERPLAPSHKTSLAARSTRRWKKAPSTLANGLALTMMPSWASTKWRLTTTSQAGGKVVRSWTCSSTRMPLASCRLKTRPSSRRLRPMPTSTCRPSTTRSTQAR